MADAVTDAASNLADVAGDAARNATEGMDPKWATALTVLYITGGLSVLCMAMRAIMFLGETACCLSKCCCCIAKCCPAWIGCWCCPKEDEEGKKAKPYPYGAGKAGSLVIMVLSMLFAILWQWYWARDMVAYSDRMAAGDTWKKESGTTVSEAWHSGGCVEGEVIYPLCIDYSASYRVSMAQFVFFTTMGLACSVNFMAHDYGWDLKCFLFGAVIIGFIFAPSTAFGLLGYGWLARITAFAFMLQQEFNLVDLAYKANAYLLSTGKLTEEGCNGYKVGVLSVCIVFYLSSFVGIILMYIFFTDGCEGLANSFISITLIMIVVFTITQLVTYEHGHNLLTSSVVTAYATYLLYIGVSANPNTSCNPTYGTQSGNSTLSVILGISFTIAGIAATVMGTGNTPSHQTYKTSTDGPSTIDVLEGGDGFSKKTAPLDIVGEDENEVGMTASPEASEYAKSCIQFNSQMAMISTYWCMVLTNWANEDTLGGSLTKPSAGFSVMWLNIVAGWIIMLVYMWTLIAPSLFPDRDFS